VKIIGIEEYFVTADIRAAWAASPIGQEGTDGFDRGEVEERLDDLGEQRLTLMDESGVDVQVLSVTTRALHNLEPKESVTLARRTNDLVVATIAKYPTRFQGFSTLATAAPKEAAAERERTVTHLGLEGTMHWERARRPHHIAVLEARLSTRRVWIGQEMCSVLCGPCRSRAGERQPQR
jgi:predicted TIM-barrel fold metal-dependent hydrolase